MIDGDKNLPETHKKASVEERTDEEDEGENRVTEQKKREREKNHQLYSNKKRLLS